MTWTLPALVLEASRFSAGIKAQARMTQKSEETPFLKAAGSVGTARWAPCPPGATGGQGVAAAPRPGAARCGPGGQWAPGPLPRTPSHPSAPTPGGPPRYLQHRGSSARHPSPPPRWTRAASAAGGRTLSSPGPPSPARTSPSPPEPLSGGDRPPAPSSRHAAPGTHHGAPQRRLHPGRGIASSNPGGALLPSQPVPCAVGASRR